MKGVKPEDLGAVRPFMRLVTDAARDAALRERTNARYFTIVASAYELMDDLPTAEIYRKMALERSPRRQELLYALALNYARQGKLAEAKALADEMLALDSDSGLPRMYYAIILSLTQGSASYRQVMDMALSMFETSVPFVPGGENLAIVQNLFNMYLSDAFKRKDARRFLEVLEFRKRFEERYEAISGSAPKGSQEAQAMIDAFKARGFAAFSVAK
jgi:tetratricopeptide (TPR) repeat protein